MTSSGMRRVPFPLALVILSATLAVAPRVSALTVDRIGANVRRHTSDVRACYVRALGRRPDLGGRIEVRFTVHADGSVSAVSIERDDLGDPAMRECVESAVRSWTFPAGREDETVTYPFLLSP